MNNTIKNIKLGFCGYLLLATATVGFAGEVKAAETDGKINFTTSQDVTGEVSKPETNPGETIIPEGGGSSKGDLRIQFVPDFDFDSQEISTGVQEYHPLFQKYKTEGSNERRAMPHFIQVTDNRGVNEGWNLKVYASTFKRAQAGDEMPYATISLNQARLSNDVYDQTEIAKRVSVFSDKESFFIPIGANNAESVLSTKTNNSEHSTNGSKTSIVLSEDYDANKTDYALDKKNAGVSFNKTNLDIPVLTDTDPYVATIIWNLTAGI